MHMEHRWGSRTPANQWVRIAVAGQPFCLARLRDVSASGAFVVTTLHASYMAAIDLRILLRPANRRGATLKGIIVREALDGIAIEWLEFNPASVRELLRASESERVAAVHSGTHASDAVRLKRIAAP
jgi:hypothetical protein